MIRIVIPTAVRIASSATASAPPADAASAPATNANPAASADAPSADDANASRAVAAAADAARGQYRLGFRVLHPAMSVAPTRCANNASEGPIARHDLANASVTSRARAATPSTPARASSASAADRAYANAAARVCASPSDRGRAFAGDEEGPENVVVVVERADESEPARWTSARRASRRSWVSHGGAAATHARTSAGVGPSLEGSSDAGFGSAAAGSARFRGCSARG